MITQKIAEIIQKNTYLAYPYVASNHRDRDVAFNAVPVNSLIRELCELFSRLTPLVTSDELFGNPDDIFNAHEFTQTALGIQERPWKVCYSALKDYDCTIIACSKREALDKVKRMLAPSVREKSRCWTAEECK